MHYSTFTSFAVVAFVSLASAAPITNSTNFNVGCQTNADCASRGPGYTCHRNICVAPPPAPSSSPVLVGCQTNADCVNRGTGYTCQRNICVAPVPAPSSSPIPFGCSTDVDCKGRYDYPTVCQHAICVPARPVSSAPAPASSSAPALGCMTNKNCQDRYPGKNAYCGPHNICMFAPISSAPVSSARPASSQPASSKPTSSAPISSATPALGCMTNKDCQDRYPGKNAYCGPHNICMFAKPSSVAPASSSAPLMPPVGCMTDKDCAGRYPFNAVCVHNMCVRKDITTTTTTTIPPPPPPPKVGCDCDADCNGRYPWEAVCEHNICVPKQPFVPTSTITVYPPPPPTTTTGVTTITVHPPPPPYTPTTVTVYECVTTTTTSKPTSSTPCAEATLFPNLIVPIKEACPNGAFGTQYTGSVSSITANNNIDSLFAFDVPFIYETQNPTCQLIFTLPAPGTGFPRTVSGSGQVDLFALQTGNGIETATWNSRPARGQYIGRVQIVDGQIAKWIDQSGVVPCTGGTWVGVEMVPVGEVELEWFEMKTPLTGLTLEIFT